MRAARTGNGVHAAGNLMSLMMVCDGPPPPECKSQSADIIDRINAHLPAQVGVLLMLLLPFLQLVLSIRYVTAADSLHNDSVILCLAILAVRFSSRYSSIHSMLSGRHHSI
jgi:hypothetical protein